MGPPWCAFCQITLTSCLLSRIKWNLFKWENCSPLAKVFTLWVPSSSFINPLTQQTIYACLCSHLKQNDGILILRYQVKSWRSRRCPCYWHHRTASGLWSTPTRRATWKTTPATFFIWRAFSTATEQSTKKLSVSTIVAVVSRNQLLNPFTCSCGNYLIRIILFRSGTKLPTQFFAHNYELSPSISLNFCVIKMILNK